MIPKGWSEAPTCFVVFTMYGGLSADPARRDQRVERGGGRARDRAGPAEGEDDANARLDREHRVGYDPGEQQDVRLATAPAPGPGDGHPPGERRAVPPPDDALAAVAVEADVAGLAARGARLRARRHGGMSSGVNIPSLGPEDVTGRARACRRGAAHISSQFVSTILTHPYPTSGAPRHGNTCAHAAYGTDDRWLRG